MATWQRFWVRFRFTRGGFLANTSSALPRASQQKRVKHLRFQKRMGTLATFTVAVGGPLLALVTFLALGPLNQNSGSRLLRFVLLADIVYVLAVAALVLQRVVSLLSARRNHSVGSKLRLRLTRFFAALALIPTITVAVFAVITVNFGLEGWFSDRVQNVLSSSFSAAEAYEEEHRRDLDSDANSLARFINATRENTPFMTDGTTRRVLVQGQSQIVRGLKEAYVIDGDGRIRARGDRSYLFDYEQPNAIQIQIAHDEGILIIDDWDNNEFRALVPLNAFVDRYLYISRTVDGEILNLLDETRETVTLYEQLESDRGQLLFEFGLIYLGFALILILAAIWAGLWFAEQLARPVGRLADAVQKVGEGNLDARVPEEQSDDEIAALGRYFNKMIGDLKIQRTQLIDNADQIEIRRRLFDSVLTSVTSGVVGLDADGHVDFVNRSAERLLDIEGAGDHLQLALTVPEFGEMFEDLRKTGRVVAQGEIRITRSNKLENLLVRMSRRLNDQGGLEGYVVAFDDVTDLVSAQRMAAWGDVARRIAHEIKNPLTPIQLSAERIQRKFGKRLGEDEASLTQYTEVIVRQTNDLRRIVDEFSKFARMPVPVKRETSLNELVASSVTLLKSKETDIEFTVDLPTAPLTATVDQGMITQVLTNLLKNAAEAIEKKSESAEIAGEIRVSLLQSGDRAELTIQDNGVGLPADRSKLFEPYYTTRSEGTGLGLPIVKKIVEDHGGSLALEIAPEFAGNSHCGAMALIMLPLNETLDDNGTL